MNDTHPVQYELDLLATIYATRRVIDGYASGDHTDIDAVAKAGRAINRQAHAALVARANQPGEPT